LTSEARAFIILVAIDLIFTVGLVVFFQVRINENNHKFCQLMTNSYSGVPTPKPADPSKNPKEARLYTNYVTGLELGYSLGCSGLPVLPH
jgi:hypothetical protein